MAAGMSAGYCNGGCWARYADAGGFTALGTTRDAGNAGRDGLQPPTADAASNFPRAMPRTLDGPTTDLDSVADNPDASNNG